MKISFIFSILVILSIQNQLNAMDFKNPLSRLRTFLNPDDILTTDTVSDDGTTQEELNVAFINGATDIVNLDVLSQPITVNDTSKLKIGIKKTTLPTKEAIFQIRLIEFCNDQMIITTSGIDAIEFPNLKLELKNDYYQGEYLLNIPSASERCALIDIQPNEIESYNVQVKPFFKLRAPNIDVIGKGNSATFFFLPQ